MYNVYISKDQQSTCKLIKDVPEVWSLSLSFAAELPARWKGIRHHKIQDLKFQKSARKNFNLRYQTIGLGCWLSWTAAFTPKLWGMNLHLFETSLWLLDVDDFFAWPLWAGRTAWSMFLWASESQPHGQASGSLSSPAALSRSCLANSPQLGSCFKILRAAMRSDLLGLHSDMCDCLLGNSEAAQAQAAR